MAKQRRRRQWGRPVGRRAALALTASALTLGLMPAAPASASAGPAYAGRAYAGPDARAAVENAGLVKLASWRMEDSADTPVMHDSVGTDNGTTYNVVKHRYLGRKGTGHSYKFDGATSYALVRPRDSYNLSPWNADFAFTVWVDTRLLVHGGDYNIMQKGQATDADGQYKLELSGASVPVGFPVCTFVGDNKSVRPVHVVAPISTNDHVWHRITCQRVSGVFRAIVDGRVYGEKPVPEGFGAIHPTGRSLGIGAKPSSPQDDFFPGLLDDASFSISTTAAG